MIALFTSLLLLALPVSSPPIHDAQVAALRAVVSGNTGYVCVAIDASILLPPVAEKARFASTRKRQDPPASVLVGLNTASTAFVPASQCTRTTRNWDIIHRATRKPAILVAVGGVEVVSPTRVRIGVLATAGFLTETWTLFEVEKSEGKWIILSSRIILQA